MSRYIALLFAVIASLMVLTAGQGWYGAPGYGYGGYPRHGGFGYGPYGRYGGGPGFGGPGYGYGGINPGTIQGARIGAALGTIIGRK
uniref:Glycine-rich protein n=1 Tax=Panagrellus redivivus TaxID=6233 RepID=A0A7E4W787_PANRE